MTEHPKQAEAEDVAAALPSLPGTEPDVGGGLTERLGEAMRNRVRQRGEALLTPDGAAATLGRLDAGGTAGGTAPWQGMVRSYGEEVMQAAVDESVQSLQDRLSAAQWVRALSLSYRPSYGSRDSLLQADVVLSLGENETTAGFAQAGVQSQDGEGGAYAGAGWRADVGGYLLGVNAFYDYLSEPQVDRYSVGGEVRGRWLDLTANWYQGLSEERQGNMRYEAADGWDVELSGHIPGARWLSFAGKYYDFDELGEGEEGTGQEYRLTIQPWPLLGLSGFYDVPEGSEADNDAGFEARMEWRFGVSLAEQMRTGRMQTAQRAWHRRYERVRREYDIRIAESGMRGVPVSAPVVTPTAITIGWSNPAGATRVRISWRPLAVVNASGASGPPALQDTGSIELNLTGAGQDQTHRVSGLRPGRRYEFDLEFLRADGTVLLTGRREVRTGDAQAAGAPTGLMAQAPSTMRIDLNWTPPAQTGGVPVTGYRIEFSTDGGTTYTDAVADTGNTEMYSHTGLMANTSYRYRVYALNAAGESAASNVVSAMTLAAGAPTHLAAVAASATQIDLNWMAPVPATVMGSAVTGYRIEASADGGTSFTDVAANTGSTAVMYSHTGLTMGTARHYRVYALNAAGDEGPMSNVANATTHAAPGAPTGLAASAVSATQIDLRWTAPSEDGGTAITGYRIEASTDGTTFSDVVANTSSTELTYSHTGLTMGTERHYRVSAINSAGTGTASNVANATTHDVPGAPAGLMATAVGTTQIDLDWTAPSEDGGTAITGYRIEASADGTTFSDLVANTGSTGLTYSHTGLSENTARHYRVSAINAVGTGAASSVANATTLMEGAPSDLTAQAVSATQINLSWTAPSPATVRGTAITGYRIEASADGTTFTNLEDDTGNTNVTYSHTAGLTAGTTRHYRVYARNAAGDEGPVSNVANATTHAAPGAPTGLTASTVSATQINLSWTEPVNIGGTAITGYKIEVSTDGGTNFTDLVADTGSAAVTYSHTGLTMGTVRHYRVSAINGAGTGTASAVAMATTHTVPGAPAGLMASTVSATQIDLSWTAPADPDGAPITGYRIEVSTDGGTAFTDLVADTGNRMVTYSHTGLTMGTARHYQVSAINSAGTGTASAVAMATTHAAPGAPTGLMATAASATQIDLSWTEPADPDGAPITGYRIEVSTDGGTAFTDLVADTGNRMVTYSHTGLTAGTTRHYQVSAINAVGTGTASAVAMATTHTVPGAPTGLMATAASPTQIDLSWTEPVNIGGTAITGYRIEVSTDGGTSFTDLVADTGNAETTYSHTGLTMGTARHYQVSAINAVGTGTASAVAMATTHTVPGAPTGLMASTVSATQIDLSWTAPADPDGAPITSYRIEVSTDGGTAFTDLVADTGNRMVTYSHTGLTMGTARHYRVSAINSVGTGTASAVAMATTHTVPGAPTGLMATAASATQINLSWTEPVNIGGTAITGYRIEVSTDGGTSFTDLVTDTGNRMVTYSHTGLTMGTERHYQVSAINSVGTGTASAVAMATTHTVPGAPTGLMASAASATQIDLSWTAPADPDGAPITGYRIEVSTDGGTSFTDLVADTGNAETTYSHTGLTMGTARHYQVSAINSAGTGTASAVAMARTHTVPGAPTGLMASTVSATQIDLSWTAPADPDGAPITGYRIEVSTDGGTAFTDLVADTGNRMVTYSHTGLTMGTTRHYQVSAINSAGTGTASAVAMARTHTAPGAPTGLMASTVSATQINLSWTEPVNIGGTAITGYKIEVSTDGGTAFTDLVADTGNAETTYSHTGLTMGTARHYRVSAINAVATGAVSNVANATTLTEGAPTGLMATAVSATQIDLSWTAPSPATVMGTAIDGYRIEVSTDGGTTYADQVSDTGNTNVTYSHTGLTMGTTRHYRVYARNAADQESSVSNVAMATTHATPGAPTGLMATAASATQINLSWTAPADPDGAPITGYRIEVSTDGGTAFTDLVADTGNRMVTYSHTGLTMGTARHYQVSAINSVGTGTASAVAMATTHTVPGAPTGLMASTVSATQINLSWTAPADPDGAPITGYRIEVSTDGGTAFTDLVADTGNRMVTYSHTGLTAGTTRHYRVSAINSVGTGTASAVAMARTHTVPGAPTGLMATAASATQINLSWTEPVNIGGTAITGYRIEVSTDGGTNFTDLVADTGNRMVTYSHTGLTMGTARHYQVSAINAVGTGTASAVAMATTHTVPGAPTGLMATAASATQIDLSWTAPADIDGAPITGYRIEVSTDGGTSFTDLVADTGNRMVTYSHTGLTMGTARHYRVSAINSAGTGTASAVAMATTHTVPGAPTGLMATAASATQINLSWTEPVNIGGTAITGYRIEVSTDGGTAFTDLVADTGNRMVTYSHTGLTMGVARHYRVSAINSAGTGTASAVATATTLTEGAPTGLTATAASATQIDLSWMAPSPATVMGTAIDGYRIEVSTDGGTTYADQVSDTGNTNVTYSHTGLTMGTTRHYRVYARNAADQESSVSNVAMATTHAAPGAPTGLMASAASATQINLSWTEPVNIGGTAITGYRIEVSTDGGTAFTDLVADTGNRMVTYSHTGLTAGTARHYQVSAINAVGTGTASAVAMATTHTVPGVPTGLMASAASATQINLSWTEPVNIGGTAITGYRIEVSTDGGTAFTDLVADTGNRMVTYSHTGLTMGTARHYQVSAINAVGTGTASAVAMATTHTAPGAPTGLMASTVSATQIDLSWTAPADPDGAPITSYRIEVSTDGGTAFTDLVADTGNAETTYSHTGLTAGIERHYRVSAINSVGTGTASAVANARTHTVPGAPTGLMATAASATQIDLSWTEPVNIGGTAITGYRIEVSTDGGTNFSDLVADTGNAETTYSHTGLTMGTTRHYQVSAINSVGTGTASAVAMATTHTVPGAPTGLMASTVSATQIDLSWTAPADPDGAPITGYRIEVSTDGGTAFTDLVADTGNRMVTYSHTGLTAGTTRHYQVSAINSAGTGTVSAVAMARTHTVPGAPTGLMATAASATQIDLSWTEPVNIGGTAITGYRIEVSTDGGTNFTDLVADTGNRMVTYSHTGLTMGTARHYQVSAINSVGTGTASAVAMATTHTAPGAPTGLMASTVSATQIDLNWTVPADPDGAPITGYRIEVSTDGGTAFTDLVTDTGNRMVTYSHTGLTMGTARHYRVSAINSVGTGTASAVAMATTHTVPGAPTGLMATAVSATQINLSWTEPVNIGGTAITGYRIEVSTDGGTAFTDLVADTGNRMVTYSHTGLTAGTARHYQVSAINAVGTGTASAVANATTHTVPGAPTGLMATAASATQINLSWTEPVNIGGTAITGYRIEVSTDGGTAFTDLVADTGNAERTYSHTGLTMGTTRHYRVSAINSVGTGTASAVAMATTHTVPGTPTGLMATAASATQINLSWTEPVNIGGTAITGYRIEVSTDGGTAFTDLVADTGNRMVTYSHTGLTMGTTRHYQVSAINSVGTGTASAVAMATTHTVPGAPTGLMATAASATQINLSWTEPVNIGGTAITGYRIEVSTDGGTAFTDLVSDTGNRMVTYSHTGLTAGTARHYQVSAINSVGTGTVSAVAMATTHTVPGAPTGLMATAASATQIDLSWTEPVNIGGTAITGYRIEVSTDGGTAFTDLVADTGNAETTYSHTGLTMGTTRHYQVSAINAVGTGTASAVAMATTHTVPGAPTGLMASAASATQIDLSWTAPADPDGAPITGYRIEVSTDGGTSFTDLVADTGNAETTYSHTGLTMGTTRHYQVSAVNSVGTGTASAVAMATTHTVPEAPTGLMASTVSATQIDLSWTAPADPDGAPITGYKIEVSTDGGTNFTDLVANTGRTNVTYSHTGLTMGVARHYRVSAINSVGTGTASAVANATTHTVPGAPTGLMASTVSATQIDLSWTAPASDGGTAITNYEIFFASTPLGPFHLLQVNRGNPPERTYSHTGLTAGTTRHYLVRAGNSVGTGFSAVAMATTHTAPGAPTGLMATAASATQINLSWTEPVNIGGTAITGYRIEVSTDGGTAFTDLVADTGNRMVTYSHTGLTTGTARHYQVSAINSAGTGTASAIANETTHTLPGAPTGLMAAASATQIDLSWTEPANDGGAITGYRIEVSTDGGTNFADLEADTGNTAVTYSHTLSMGTTRHYRVSAVNSAGTGTASAVAMATTHTVPGAPTGLMASTVSTTQIDLSWTEPVNIGGTAITGYRIEVSTDGGTTFSDLEDDTGNRMVTYSHTGLMMGVTRHYQVSAINSVGTGTASAVAMATTLIAGAPSGLMATAASETQIDLSWTAPSPATVMGSAITGYRIEASADGTTFADLEDDTGNTNVTYSHTGLTMGTARHYRVYARNAANQESPVSNVANATTHAAPGAPTGLMAAAASTTRTDLSWTAPANDGGAAITSYWIQWATTPVGPFRLLWVNRGSPPEGTYSDTGGGLTRGTTRYYRVRAGNSVGSGTASAVANATTHTLPGAPTGLTATAVSATQIDLSWTEPASDGGTAITGYLIFVSTDGGGGFTTLVAHTGSTEVTYSDTGLTAGTARHYRVSAINAVGTGTASAAAMATTHTGPGAPTGLMAVVVSATQIDLSWMEPANDGGTAITGYRIWGSFFFRGRFGPFTVLEADTDSTDVTYSHTGTRGSSWRYWVEAINSVGTGADSEVAVAMFPAALGAPTGLTAVAVSTMQIDLSWTVPASDGGSAITGYRIEVSTDGGTNFSDLEDDTGNAETTYSHTGLSANTARHYRVSAINAVATGAVSNVANATTLMAGAPTGLTATVVSAARIDLSWTAPSPATVMGSAITGYRIEVSTDGGTTFADQVEDTANTNVTYSHTGLAGETTRHYRVYARNAANQESPVSNVASATTLMVGAPTGLMAAAASATRIDLGWTAPADTDGAPITGYKIEVSTDGGTSFSNLEADTGNTMVMYSHTGLTRGVTRHYRVSAINAVGTGTASAVAMATTHTVPGAPLLRIRAAGATQIELIWWVPASDGGTAITGYRIEVSADGTSFTDLEADTGSTERTYSHTGLTAGTMRHYRVSAINGAGTGTASAIVTATTANTVPGAPTGLTATAVSVSQIDLSWTAPVDDGGTAITGYRIDVERTTFSGTIFDQVGITGSTERTYSHTDLTTGAVRRYRVRAINAVGNGFFSGSAMARTHTLPGAPTGLMANAAGATQIDLSWTAPGNIGGTAITGYRIEVSTDGGRTFADLVANTGSTERTYSHTGLTMETRRFYRVRAINAVGNNGFFSNSAVATTHAAPGVPWLWRVRAASATQIDLSWVPRSDGGTAITGYRIEVSTDGGTTFADLVANTGSTEMTYSHTGLTMGTERHYRVSAINAVGTGMASNVANATTHTLPGAPADLTARAVSATRIDLVWNTPVSHGGTGIMGYRVEVSTDGGTTYATHGHLLTREPVGSRVVVRYIHGGLSGNATRHYRVSAINAVGTGAASTVAATTLMEGAPAELTARGVSATQIDLSWTAPATVMGSAITGYRIEVSTDGGTTYADQVADTGNTDVTYSHTGLTMGTTRHYRVYARNAAGQESPVSNVALATTHAAPAAPTMLTATAASATRIDLSWTAPNARGAAITGYRVEVSEDGGTNFTDLATNTGSADVTTYTHNTGLTMGTTRHYRVSAINAVGTGAASTVAATTHTLPGAPTGLTAAAVSATQIDLSWTAPVNIGGTAITSYHIQVSTDGTNFVINLPDTNNSRVTYSHTGLTAGTTRYYRVRAENRVGIGSFSAVANATTHDVPGAPTGLTATAASATQIDLSWTAPADDGGAAIRGYQILVSTDGGVNYGHLGGTSSTRLTLSHTGLTRETTRHYRVRAGNSAGLGLLSNVANATTHAVPGAPTNLRATVMGSDRIDLSWDEPADSATNPVTSYRVGFNTTGADADFAYLTIDQAATIRTYSHTGLMAGTTYYYRVKADTADGRTSASEVVGVTTTDP